ncbi:hypothetical protein FPQ18DRAFT_381190 [Pyronema domesticum]|nr:hypothetical protein FPQ18DRAFT_381190 [Pyronema domesticum]
MSQTIYGMPPVYSPPDIVDNPFVPARTALCTPPPTYSVTNENILLEDAAGRRSGFVINSTGTRESEEVKEGTWFCRFSKDSRQRRVEMVVLFCFAVVSGWAFGKYVLKPALEML